MDRPSTSATVGSKATRALTYEPLGAAVARGPYCHRGVVALILVLCAFPIGVGMTIGFSRGNSGDAMDADILGIGITCLTAAAGTALAWHAGREIRSNAAALRGQMTASVAFALGWFVIAACVVAAVMAGMSRR